MSEKWKHTNHIKFHSHGKGHHDERFVRVSFRVEGRPKTLWFRYDNAASEKGAFEQLSRKGAHLVTKQARDEFLNRIQKQGPSEGISEKVATKPGWCGNQFIVPSGVALRAPDTKPVAVSLTDMPDEIGSLYNDPGSLDSWQKFTELAKGNTRMTAGASLAFLGPCSKFASLESVMLQFVGSGGIGKTPLAGSLSAIWGWDSASSGHRLGGAFSWNVTANKLEEWLAGLNSCFLVLDETTLFGDLGKAEVAREFLKTIQRMEGGRVKGRMNYSSPLSWFVPVLSTSNRSVMDIIAAAGIDVDPSVYTDRLIDIPPPAGGYGMFETLHGYVDVAEFSVQLTELASGFRGGPARKFINSLIGKNAAWVKMIIENRRQYYIKQAKAKIGSGGDRDLTRIHGRFANLYAAGQLAAQLDVWRITRDALLDAIIACEEAHVRLVARRAGDGEGPPRVARPSPHRRLVDYIRENEASFIDTAKETLSDPSNGHAGAIGYVAMEAGNKQFYFSDQRFSKIAGDKLAAHSLKRELERRNLIAMTGAGEQGKRFSCRKQIGVFKGKSVRGRVVSISAAILESDIADDSKRINA